jgi:hypothetical protein
MTQSANPAVRRAAVLSDFGEAGNVSIRELPMPSFRFDEMLVRVKATSVNPIEWKMRRGLGLPPSPSLHFRPPYWMPLLPVANRREKFSTKKDRGNGMSPPARRHVDRSM